MDIAFWGIRGSHPAIAEYSAYGNHTSCVEVTAGNLRLIFDAGTGIHSLGKTLIKDCENKELHLFFTHYHLDHVLGLLNFQPVYQPNWNIYFYGPKSENRSCETVLKEIFDKPYHPIALKDLSSTRIFTTLGSRDRFNLSAGEKEEDRVFIESLALNHPGGALGYRVTYKQKSFAYITDVVLGESADKEEIIRFIEGADLLVTDTTYSNEDYQKMPMKRSWGHSSWEEAVELATSSKVKRLMLFHLDPNKDDRELDRIFKAGKKAFDELAIPREGESFTL